MPGKTPWLVFNRKTTFIYISFILNYNIYDVEVRLESGEVITLGKYEYKEI